MISSPDVSSTSHRPIVFDYGSPAEFLKTLLSFYKETGSFSLRQRTARTGSLSQALVSQILNGRRQLTRDNFPAIAAIFKLTKIEQDFIEKQLLRIHFPEVNPGEESRPSPKRQAKNHILSDWLHPYVKDLVNLRGFSLDTAHLHHMLLGMASPQRIKKSTDFLLREGFWRRTLEGSVVPEDAAVTTTNEIPTENIRTFHKKALEIAHRGISSLPAQRRKASTVLVSVDAKKMDELRGLVDSFQQQLLEFIDKNPEGKDHLVQVTIHLTPIGSAPHDIKT